MHDANITHYIITTVKHPCNFIGQNTCGIGKIFTENLNSLVVLWDIRKANILDKSGNVPHAWITLSCTENHFFNYTLSS